MKIFKSPNFGMESSKIALVFRFLSSSSFLPLLVKNHSKNNFPHFHKIGIYVKFKVLSFRFLKLISSSFISISQKPVKFSLRCSWKFVSNLILGWKVQNPYSFFQILSSTSSLLPRLAKNQSKLSQFFLSDFHENLYYKFSVDSSKIVTVNTNKAEAKFARIKLHLNATNALNQDVYWLYANGIYLGCICIVYWAPMTPTEPH